MPRWNYRDGGICRKYGKRLLCTPCGGGWSGSANTACESSGRPNHGWRGQFGARRGLAWFRDEARWHLRPCGCWVFRQRRCSRLGRRWRRSHRSNPVLVLAQARAAIAPELFPGVIVPAIRAFPAAQVRLRTPRMSCIATAPVVFRPTCAPTVRATTPARLDFLPVRRWKDGVVWRLPQLRRSRFLRSCV